MRLFLVLQEYEIDQKLGIKVRIDIPLWLSISIAVESLITLIIKVIHNVGK